MIKFKMIPDMDKPRERLKKCGASNLANEELISIILKTGSKEYSVKEISLKLLEYIGDISKLNDIGINSLMKIPGIGEVKAIELKAAIELGKRVFSNEKTTNIKIVSSSDIYDLLGGELKDKKQEFFYCIYLDIQQKYIDKKCLFIGTVNSSTVHPREIFKEAYLLSASKIICIHNHPSGEVNPSKQDINLTHMIKEIGLIHGIELIDHIIIGDGKYYSFSDNGQL